MFADVAVSLAVLVGMVALSDVTRRTMCRILAGTYVHVYAAELVSTFQLCCCTHELRLLSEMGVVPAGVSLTLTYLAAVTHGLTFRGATGNPIGTLEHAYRSRITGTGAVLRISCQFVAAGAARAAVQVMWGRGLSVLHTRHTLSGFWCASAIRAPPHTAACVELACAFAVQTAVTHTRALQEKYRVHAIAAVITSVVYAGGSATGAVFNPALAFSTLFSCTGSSLLEYCVVYWMGPLLGMMFSVLLFDKLSRKVSSQSPLDTTKRK
ncbi:aquaporin-11 [Dunckerocampus dactyliophorus]|uniref:aquaporin-11 n=1 Tax=Dunckerocampus dactyliophorus TaxID=161453 RepID=UPI002404CADE|nr:aquaporin-11 [Dunckerocampus dactyliophorus]